MKCVGIIPARYGSRRFPGKALHLIDQKPLIQHTYENAHKCTMLDQIVIATDDKRIQQVAKQFGAEVHMTSAKHRNGTERCAEVARSLSADYLFNIQGDLARFSCSHIEHLITLCDRETEIATILLESNVQSEKEDPNIVKAVISQDRNALYFSREAIPNNTGNLLASSFYKHVGIYAYRKDILLQVADLPPTPLERLESLEQLRWLESGYTIKTVICDEQTISIDSKTDLEHLNVS
ncbi:MAG: 3-deoxy-manno-octulosonate cytidylyltransferase [Bacteroidota bacterium]